MSVGIYVYSGHEILGVHSREKPQTRHHGRVYGPLGNRPPKIKIQSLGAKLLAKKLIPGYPKICKTIKI